MEATQLPILKSKYNQKVKNNQKVINSDCLSDYSPQDKPWDNHRSNADDVGFIYAGAQEFERYAQRIDGCSGLLRFGWSDNENGESRLALKEAHFCRVRYCPVCQWRRSLMWQARFYQSLPSLVESYPKARWLFLTLTVKNCPVSELRETLQSMNKAWQRLIKRKEFKPVTGWIRTTEVTRGSDGTAHPHFHVLLMVPPSWFTRDYVKKMRWVELWQESMKLDYLPSVDIRTVKPKVPKEGQLALDATAQALQGAVAETLKYSTKADDMIGDEDWFLELTRQTHKLRFIATGGALKNVLRVDEETDKDLVLGSDSEDDDGTRLAFGWQQVAKQYKRAPKADKY